MPSAILVLFLRHRGKRGTSDGPASVQLPRVVRSRQRIAAAEVLHAAIGGRHQGDRDLNVELPGTGVDLPRLPHGEVTVARVGVALRAR